MARRDVELVIRARDEAQNALTSINKALTDFTTNTASVRDEATKTDTRLGALGGAFRELSQAVGALGATGRVEGQLRRITEEIDRQEVAISRTEKALTEYQDRFAQTRTQTERLSQVQARLSSELEKARAAVQRSQEAQRGLGTETARAQRAQEQFANRQNTLNAQVTKQNGLLADYESRLSSLRTEIQATAQPTATLVRNFERTERNIERTRSKIADLVETQNLIQASSDRASSSVARANDIYAAQANALTRNQTVLKETEVAFREAATAAQASATEQARLEAAANKSSTSLEKQNASLQKARSAYQQTESVIRETAGALEQLDAATRRGLLSNLREQINRVQGAKQAYKELSAEATKLGAALSSTTAPTNAQTTAFERFRAAASQARQEFRSQGQALSDLRSVLRESGGDVDVLRDRVQRFQQTLQGARSGYANLQQQAGAAANASQRLAREQARASTAASNLAAATTRTSAAMATGAGRTSAFAAAIRQFYGESRTALGFTQRLRGEVLSLIAAYGGIFAAVEGFRGVTNAYQTLEAAQNRLSAAFDGDELAVGTELDFIRRQADRLGIQFGILSQEYSKFAIATQGTNLEGAATRTIFRQVAEAARVQGLSLDNLQGVFVALTQIVSKGVVSMEELRQQLGDRLPGALQILSAGLGKSTEEVIKLIENGQLSSDSLSAFGDELEKRFGDRVPAALASVNTAIGRFQNAIFQAFLTIGEGGAIEGFTNLLNGLIDAFDSAAVVDFLTNVGAALGGFLELLGAVAVNWDLVIVAITTFTAFKLAGFVFAIVTALNAWRLSLIGVIATSGGAAAATRGLAASLGAAVVGVNSLRAAFTLLLSATGIGALVTLIGTGIGIWATRGSDATEVMIRHREIVDQVKNAYDSTGGSIDQIREKLEGLTQIEVEQGLREDTAQFERSIKEFENAIPQNSLGEAFDNVNLDGFFVKLQTLAGQLRNGELGVEDFRAKVEELSINMRDQGVVADNVIQKFDELARGVVEPGANMQRFRDILVAVFDAEGDASEALERITGRVRETGTVAAREAARVSEFQGVLRELGEDVPALKDEFDRLDDVQSLDKLLQQANNLTTSTKESINAIREYQRALNTLRANDIFDNAGGGGNVGAAAALLANQTGFQSVGANGQGGFGSDTITLADGSIRQITDGMAVSLADAQRDLVRRVGELNEVIEGQIGETRFESFSDEQQAVLTSIARDFGELPKAIVDAIESGSTEQIADAIRNNEDSPRGQFRGDVFANGGQAGVGAFVDAENRRTDALERQAELERQARESTLQRIEDAEFEIAQQALINSGKEREAEIAAAIRQAEQENVNITDTQIAKVGELAGRKFDLANAEKQANSERERSQEIEGDINELVAQRTALQSLLTAQLESGAASGEVQETRDALNGVNEQLREAIDNALQLLATFDQTDPSIASATARLKELQLSGQQAASGIVISFDQVARSFSGSFTNAALGFAQAIAEGQSATSALGNAFRQFAAEFLQSIARMILQQLALNAAKAVGRAFGFGVAHSGGVIGARGAQRRVSAAAFAGATRYHQGGIAGLRPGEVPTILQRGEEVLTRDDPRHIFNGAGNGQEGVSAAAEPRIVNAIDGASFLEEAMKSKRGQETILNFIQANRGSVRGAIGN